MGIHPSYHRRPLVCSSNSFNGSHASRYHGVVTSVSSVFGWLGVWDSFCGFLLSVLFILYESWTAWVHVKQGLVDVQDACLILVQFNCFCGSVAVNLTDFEASDWLVEPCLISCVASCSACRLIWWFFILLFGFWSAFFTVLLISLAKSSEQM